MTDTYDNDDIEDHLDEDADDQSDTGAAHEPDADDEGEEAEVSWEGEEGGKGGDKDLVRHLRAQLEEERKRTKFGADYRPPEVIDPGPRPTLESCDYDEDKLADQMDAWHDKRRKAEEQTRLASAAEQETTDKAKTQWAERQAQFVTKRDALGVRDFETAEANVVAALGGNGGLKLGVIVKHCDDPAKVVYALGKSPAKLAEMAAIEDVGDFLYTLGKLEGKITLKPTRRSAPDPDETVTGGARLSAGKGKLEKQLEEAERKFEKAGGGDRTEIRRLKARIAEAGTRR